MLFLKNIFLYCSYFRKKIPVFKHKLILHILILCLYCFDLKGNKNLKSTKCTILLSKKNYISNLNIVMKDFFLFIKSKVFFKHFTIAILSLVVLLWILFKLLGIYTHHGETAVVPDFKGKLISELDKFIVEKKVRYAIIDSVYEPQEKSGIVLKQEPEANSEVKHNRIIYLYVTSTQPPQIAMPKLVDRSSRQALFMIESYGLKQGTVNEITADCKGCVVKQLYKGKEILAGDPIKKGSKIDLLVGKKENDYLAIPTDSSLTNP